VADGGALVTLHYYSGDSKLAQMFGSGAKVDSNTFGNLRYLKFRLLLEQFGYLEATVVSNPF
jgi:hypothetical protein